MTADDPRDALCTREGRREERAARGDGRAVPSGRRAVPNDGRPVPSRSEQRPSGSEEAPCPEPPRVIRVRPSTPDDLDRLEGSGAPAAALRHHRERLAMQGRRECVQLLAWDGDEPVGHGTLLLTSKYAEVSALWPGIPEINALAAYPTGRGTGTVLLAAAEDAARDRGCARIGIAVEPGNPDARRLYERLGYCLADGLRVIDRWTEQHEDGTRTEHADPCDYLVKDLSRD